MVAVRLTISCRSKHLAHVPRQINPLVKYGICSRPLSTTIEIFLGWDTNDNAAEEAYEQASGISAVFDGSAIVSDHSSSSGDDEGEGHPRIPSKAPTTRVQRWTRPLIPPALTAIVGMFAAARDCIERGETDALPQLCSPPSYPRSPESSRSSAPSQPTPSASFSLAQPTFSQVAERGLSRAQSRSSTSSRAPCLSFSPSCSAPSAQSGPSYRLPQVAQRTC